jgi:hypothetical protein
MLVLELLHLRLILVLVIVIVFLQFWCWCSAIVSNIIVTNVYITNPGSGYTATDLAASPIATFSPVGTSATVGFGVSTISLVNLGIGYTSTASAAITFSSPTIGIASTATATAGLGYPGILPGPGVNTTGNTQIYYAIPRTTSFYKISTGVGVGTLTSTDVGDDVFAVQITSSKYWRYSICSISSFSWFWLYCNK